MTKTKRKIILGSMGSILAVAAPVATVVSCRSVKNTKNDVLTGTINIQKAFSNAYTHATQENHKIAGMIQTNTTPSTMKAINETEWQTIKDYVFEVPVRTKTERASDKIAADGSDDATAYYTNKLIGWGSKTFDDFKAWAPIDPETGNPVGTFAFSKTAMKLVLIRGNINYTQAEKDAMTGTPEKINQDGIYSAALYLNTLENDFTIFSGPGTQQNAQTIADLKFYKIDQTGANFSVKDDGFTTKNFDVKNVKYIDPMGYFIGDIFEQLLRTLGKDAPIFNTIANKITNPPKNSVGVSFHAIGSSLWKAIFENSKFIAMGDGSTPPTITQNSLNDILDKFDKMGELKANNMMDVAKLLIPINVTDTLKIIKTNVGKALSLILTQTKINLGDVKAVLKAIDGKKIDLKIKTNKTHEFSIKIKKITITDQIKSAIAVLGTNPEDLIGPLIPLALDQIIDPIIKSTFDPTVTLGSIIMGGSLKSNPAAASSYKITISSYKAMSSYNIISDLLKIQNLLLKVLKIILAIKNGTFMEGNAYSVKPEDLSFLGSIIKPQATGTLVNSLVTEMWPQILKLYS